MESGSDSFLGFFPEPVGGHCVKEPLRPARGSQSDLPTHTGTFEHLCESTVPFQHCFSLERWYPGEEERQGGQARWVEPGDEAG